MSGSSDWNTWDQLLSIESLLIGLKDGKTPDELVPGLARVAAYRIGLAYSGSEKAESRFGELMGILAIGGGNHSGLDSELRIWFERGREDRRVRVRLGYWNCPRKKTEEKELPQTYEEWNSRESSRHEAMPPAVMEDKRNIMRGKILDKAREWKERGGTYREFVNGNNISRLDRSTLPGIKDEVRRVWVVPEDGVSGDRLDTV